MKNHLSLATIVLTLVAVLAETSWGRGFGGIHGGMRRSGMSGARGGGMRGVGGGGRMGEEMGPSAGARPGGNFGGGRPGGAPPGGNFGGGRLGGFGNAAANRPPNFAAGRPGPAGRGSFGGFGAAGPGAAGPAAGRFPGGAANGFGGNPSSGGGRVSGAAGPRLDNQLPSEAGRPGRQFAQPIGDPRLDNSLPSDGGLPVAGRNPFERYPNVNERRRADYVRRDFRGGNYYTGAWYRRYPGAWYPRRWAADDVWAAASWASMNDWLGYENTEPTYYAYGNNVTYQNDAVNVNGQQVGTADQYYQQAQDLANTGAGAQTQDDEQWMPLGVFAMTHDQHNKANLILQLAINKEGVIRGNYTATVSNDTKPVQGSVDKKTQKAAWTIGSNTENVIETGIYNLTKDGAPILVHFGKDKTEQWLLVRVKQNEQQSGAGQ